MLLVSLFIHSDTYSLKLHFLYLVSHTIKYPEIPQGMHINISKFLAYWLSAPSSADPTGNGDRLSVGRGQVVVITVLLIFTNVSHSPEYFSPQICQHTS